MKYLLLLGLLALAAQPAKKKTVLLDSWFNNEIIIDSSGQAQRWHYKWEEQDNNGFSLLAGVFIRHGIDTATSYTRPSAAVLDKAGIYIIVDPDIPAENPKPNYIEAGDAETIYNWVKKGGVLVLMGNDAGNAEFDHFNVLAGKFGIHFNQDSRNHVQDDHFETGALRVDPHNPVIRTARKIYLKDICTLRLAAPARPALSDKGQVIMATARIGKGTVFAVGDPWLYNEYTDGKKLPEEYENETAANDLVEWLLKQLPEK
jgi:unsaturated rhamnogalacturonyl hydrolase